MFSGVSRNFYSHSSNFYISHDKKATELLDQGRQHA